MPAYVIVNVDVRDPERYAEYLKHAIPSIQKYGGRALVRAGRTEVWEGAPQPKRVIVLEFKSMDAARTWWDSPEYRAAKKFRENIAEGHIFCVEGVSRQ